LDEGVARWVRTEAAKQRISVSRFVEDILQGHMRSENAYEEARCLFFSVQPRPLQSGDKPLPAREEIHHRSDPR
ncbi:MAG TPA: hypothetical protein VGM86_16875, partial [Thermoanaerobaculia bacterium]